MHVPWVLCLRYAVFFLRFLRMLQKRGVGSGERGTGTEHGERKNEKWEQNKDLEMKWMIGLGFKLGFVPIFHFPVARARSSLPVPSSSNILLPRKLLGQVWVSNMATLFNYRDVWRARHRWRYEHPVAKSFDNHVYFSEKNFSFATLIKFYRQIY